MFGEEATLMLVETDGTLLTSASVFKHLRTSKSVDWFWAVVAEPERTGPGWAGPPVLTESSGTQQQNIQSAFIYIVSLSLRHRILSVRACENQRRNRPDQRELFTATGRPPEPKHPGRTSFTKQGAGQEEGQEEGGGGPKHFAHVTQ